MQRNWASRIVGRVKSMDRSVRRKLSFDVLESSPDHSTRATSLPNADEIENSPPASDVVQAQVHVPSSKKIFILNEKRFQPPKKDEISDLILKEIEPSSALINQEEMQKAPYEIKNQLEVHPIDMHKHDVTHNNIIIAMYAESQPERSTILQKLEMHSIIDNPIFTRKLENDKEVMIEAIDDGGQPEKEADTEHSEDATPLIVNANPTSQKRKTKERKVNTKKNFIDYVSDDELLDYQWDSSSWDGTQLSESDESDEDENKRKKKKRKSQKFEKIFEEDEVVGERGLKRKKINMKKTRSQLRQAGKAYSTVKGKNIPEKTLQPNPCAAAKKCPFKCVDVSEEKRKAIFQHFNDLNLQRKRDWLVAMTSKNETERKRNKDANRRHYSFKYYINEGEGRRQVCLRFMINTLDTSQKFIHYTLSQAEDMGSAKLDMRGKATPGNKTKSEVLEAFVNFIKKLPAVPSHYCRKDSTRLYLPSEMKNLTNLYDKYKTSQREKGLEFVGEKIFRNIFINDFNIAFHVPKKDKCQTCTAFQNFTNPSEAVKEKKEKHDKEKELSRERFQFHQKIRKTDNTALCVSFDLQKVLNTPMGDSMLLFYCRKYTVFNLTFYESITREGYCYTWGESEGKRGSNEVATIIVKYLKSLDERAIAKRVIFYCDSCPGQNKNKVILAAIHHFLQKSTSITTVQINYLIPGHTQMPVDSMHAVIENSISKTTVWAPSQWATVFQLARKTIKPYNVEVLSHSDFLGYDLLAEKYFRGNLVGKTSKMKIVTLKQNVPDKIYVRYSFSDMEPIQSIDVTGLNHWREKEVTRIYKGVLPLPKQKYTDLINLCKKNTIPNPYQREYQEFTSCIIKETLPETDVEDSDSDYQ